MRADIGLPGTRGAAHGRNLTRFIFSGAYKLRMTNSHFVPPRGRVILAANHTGFLDGPLLFACSPRPVHLVAKSDIFKPPADRLLRATGQISLVYESADRTAVQTAIEVLNAERALGIFPEAHRGRGDFARLRNGIAYLHARTAAPIVPVAILGTRATGMGKNGLPPLRSTIDVVFGMPFRVPIEADPQIRATLAIVGEAIRQRLTDHVALALAETGQQLPADDTSIQTLRALRARADRSPGQ